MALTWNQTDTDAGVGTNIACSGATAGTVSADRLCTEGGTAGSASLALGGSLFDNGLTRSLLYLKVAVPAGATWGSGNWTVNLNVTVASASVTWSATYVCRMNSSNVSQETLGSLTGQTTSIATTGVKQHIISQAGTATPAADDYVWLVLIFTAAQNNRTFTVVLDQTISAAGYSVSSPTTLTLSPVVGRGAIVAPVIAAGSEVSVASQVARGTLVSPVGQFAITLLPSPEVVRGTVVVPTFDVGQEVVLTPSTGLFTPVNPAIVVGTAFSLSGMSGLGTLINPTVDQAGGAVDVILSPVPASTVTVSPSTTVGTTLLPASILAAGTLIDPLTVVSTVLTPASLVGRGFLTGSTTSTGQLLTPTPLTGRGTVVAPAFVTSLLTGLKAYWHLDEISAGSSPVSRVDEISGHSLTDNNTTPSSVRFGVAAVANLSDASNEYLSLASHADLQGGDKDFTLLCEVEFKTKPAHPMALVSKDNTSPGGSREYLLEWDNTTNRFRFTCYRATDTVAGPAVANTLGSPAVSRRHMVLAWHDATADTLNIQVNNTTVDSIASGGALQSASGAEFRIGRPAYSSTNDLDAYIRRVAKWDRVLTSDERTQLWNSGVGWPYPFTAPLVVNSGSAVATDVGVFEDHNIKSYRTQIASVDLGGTEYQAVVYWNSSSKLTIGKRTLPSGSWTLYAMDGTGGRPDITLSGADGHDVCSIGIDPNGFIHVSYDMHAEALNYRRSNAAISTWTGAMTAELSMTGSNETAVTYPTFFNDPSGVLYFIFRDGASGDGDLFCYKYNHATTTWAGVTGTTSGKVINGKTSSPDQSPYWARPKFDTDFGSGGRMHLAWVWRTTGDGTTNHDVSYVGWDGTNWTKASGTSQTIPITLANCEIAASEAESTGLFNELSCDSDSQGNPHICYETTDGSGYSNAYHVWHDGSGWNNTQVTANATILATTGEDNGYSQPEIVIRRSDDRALVLYRGYAAGYGVFYRHAIDPYTSWSETQLTDVDVGRWNPAYDRRRWSEETVLDLPVTFYQQNGGVPVVLRMLDFSLVSSDITLSLSSMVSSGVVVGPLLTFGNEVTLSPTPGLLSTVVPSATTEWQLVLGVSLGSAAVVSPTFEVVIGISLLALSSGETLLDPDVAAGVEAGPSSLAARGILIALSSSVGVSITPSPETIIGTLVVPTVTYGNVTTLQSQITSGTIVPPEATIVTGVLVSPLSILGTLIPPSTATGFEVILPTPGAYGTIVQPSAGSAAEVLASVLGSSATLTDLTTIVGINLPIGPYSSSGILTSLIATYGSLVTLSTFTLGIHPVSPVVSYGQEIVVGVVISEVSLLDPVVVSVYLVTTSPIQGQSTLLALVVDYSQLVVVSPLSGVGVLVAVSISGGYVPVPPIVDFEVDIRYITNFVINVSATRNFVVDVIEIREFTISS